MVEVMFILVTLLADPATTQSSFPIDISAESLESIAEAGQPRQVLDHLRAIQLTTPQSGMLRARLALRFRLWEEAEVAAAPFAKEDDLAADIVAAARARSISDELRIDIEPCIPRHPVGSRWSRRGWILVDRGDLIGARAQFEAAIGFEYNDASAWSGYGLCELQLGTVEKAMECFGYARQIDGNNFDAIFGTAAAHLKLGQLEEARALWRHLTDQLATPHEAVFLLAESHLDAAEFDAALPLYERLVKSLPTDERAVKGLAVAREGVKGR